MHMITSIISEKHIAERVFVALPTIVVGSTYDFSLVVYIAHSQPPTNPARARTIFPTGISPDHATDRDHFWRSDFL